MSKQPPKPIDESIYQRFKYRLVEISGEWADRNLLIFLIGVATGYRLQDIIDLTIADLKSALDYGEFNIQEKKQYNAWKTHLKKNPKSNKKAPDRRKHKIVNILGKEIREYIKGKRKSEYAFPSNKGQGSKHIQAKSYSEFLKKVAQDNQIQLRRITGHSLRKTYASRLYESTNDLEYVRIALGHKNIEVTKVYLGIEDISREKAAEIAARRL